MPEQLFDWTTVFSPTHSFCSTQVASPPALAQRGATLYEDSNAGSRFCTPTPCLPPPSFPILNSTFPASQNTTNPEQSSTPLIFSAPHHATLPVSAPTPAAYMGSSAPHVSPPSFPTFSVHMNPSVPHMSPPSFPVLNSAFPTS
ncbi:hypothetical protein FS749_007968 [Ceratobasidium sp. UAMH 11750]|nr:hypothetical protein FS749_007968 [Ceratobasidium sp. UAMH 11750]